ncbi:putative bifunctional diguanylate cyclase/phosphodiesterase [Legionella bozemanae]|uniref:Sensory box protein n=1 Tax=Legionella bozemanae TaxID=447 RepID=A0A0W0RYD6_LEGBO|nr:bifunctional diguanylate cyclase/phosphodiesterase [Legionella bozemanae]KTC75909.1 sensory box protein [Legionella bozemanae]STO35466.1 Bacteriophytochrome cph2 [Legionella bozemanae]
MNSEANNVFRILPKAFLLFIILTLTLSTLGILLGFKLGFSSFYQDVSIYHALFYWSLGVIALVLVLLGFSYYKLTKDKIAFCISVSYLIGVVFYFTACLVNNWFTPLNYNLKNFHGFVWLGSNTFISFLLVVTLGMCLIKSLTRNYFIFSVLLILSCIIFGTEGFLISWSSYPNYMPRFFYPNEFITHPFGLINLALNLYLAFITCYQLDPKKWGVLLNAVKYSAFAQILMSIYMVFGSSKLLDTAYLVASLLQLCSFIIPVIGLIQSFQEKFFLAFKAQENLQQQKDKFEKLSTIDSLTLLMNKAAFEATMAALISNYQRYGRRFTLIYLDLDNFKFVNDSLGHEVGDKLLQEVASRLKKSIRIGDYCARLGGDEFAIIFPELFEPYKIQSIAENLINVFNAPFEIHEHILSITASFGIAIYPDSGVTYQDMLKNADTSMYEAKKSGKNTYVFYSPILSKSQLEELEIGKHLRDAIKNNELSLHYLPIYCLTTRKLMGAELLLRWNSQNLGKMGAYEFFRIAEKTGLMIPIGEWILETACFQIKHWNEKYNKKLQFFINISSIEFANNNFINHIESLIFKSKVDNITLELTEKSLLENRVKIEKNLLTLTRLGVKLALDNFGTGYSSFILLKTLPIDTLKIDNTFIKNVEKNIDLTILRTIIKLAHLLNLKVVAKGLETEQQLKTLIEEKCDFGQGYLFSRAVNKYDFECMAYKSTLT